MLSHRRLTEKKLFHHKYQTLFPLARTFAPIQPHNLNEGRNDALTKQN